MFSMLIKYCTNCGTQISNPSYNAKCCSLQCVFERSSNTPPNAAGCILWTGTKRPDGYGLVQYKGQQDLAHRFAYINAYGPIPKGMVVCHKCDVTDCINPSHLFIGSQADNVEDCRKKGRVNFGENHWNSKLTVEAVLDIKTHLRNKTMRGVALAKKYGVTAAVIYHIKAGRLWCHI